MRIRTVVVCASLFVALHMPAQSGAPQGNQGNAWTPVTAIDFSAAHNALILNPDGTILPMDQPYYTSKNIAPGTWQIMGDGDYCYLIEGDTEAMMVDSGYGAGNVRAYAQTLTKKPIHMVANTHPHFDHTANDPYFDHAYMSQGTKDHLPKPGGSFKGVTFPMDYPITVIPEGYVFHLGNRDIEVILLGNHAPGGTAYLDRKARILYSGDEISGKQGISVRVSMDQWAAMLAKLEAHRPEYDTLCAGYEMLDATWVDKYSADVKYILSGHEGVPLTQTTPAPPPNNWPTGPAPADPQGRPVYFRHTPRFADNNRPANSGIVPGQAVSGAGADPNMRQVNIDGAILTYDIRKLHD